MEIGELLKEILKAILPIVILLFGGQYLLDKYAIRRKKKEAEIELLKKTREEKYAIVHQLYNLFGEFMRLYRKINSPLTNLESIKVKTEIFDEVIKSESQIDAIILKIGCEFIDENDNEEEVEEMLGNLRQSVQIWRERVRNGEKLPFNRSHQEDYLRFKTAFSFVSAYMTNKIHGQLETPNIKMKRVEGTLVGAFDNKYEKWNMTDLNKKSQFKKYYATNLKKEDSSEQSIKRQ
jgi:hypothetical protein